MNQRGKSKFCVLQKMSVQCTVRLLDFIKNKHYIVLIRWLKALNSRALCLIPRLFQNQYHEITIEYHSFLDQIDFKLNPTKWIFIFGVSTKFLTADQKNTIEVDNITDIYSHFNTDSTLGFCISGNNILLCINRVKKAETYSFHAFIYIFGWCDCISGVVCQSSRCIWIHLPNMCYHFCWRAKRIHSNKYHMECEFLLRGSCVRVCVCSYKR